MSRCVTIVSRHLRDGHIEVTLLSRCSDLHLVFVWGCFRWKANFPVIIPLYVVDIEVIFDGEVARHDFGSENKREKRSRHASVEDEEAIKILLSLRVFRFGKHCITADCSVIRDAMPQNDIGFVMIGQCDHPPLAFDHGGSAEKCRVILYRHYYGNLSKSHLVSFTPM